MSKKIICAILALVMIVGLVPVSAVPAFAAASGKAGPTMKWSYDESSKVLTITGKGALSGRASVGDTPWKAYNAEIETVVFPAGMKFLGENNFDASVNKNLHSVKISDITAWCDVHFKGVNPLSFAHNLYLDGELVKDLRIPRETPHIAAHAFEGCYLHSVNISGDVEYIGDHAFANCPNLNSVTLHRGVEQVYAGAFENCTALESVSIQNPVDYIGGRAFYGCTKLSSVTFGSKVAGIGEYAFENTALTEVDLPTGLETLGAGAFRNCKKLYTVTLPNTLAVIPTEAFANCPTLINIYVPESVTTIEAHAFDGCDGMHGVTTADLASWLKIDFQGMNPLEKAHILYEGVDGKIIKDLVIPEDITVIKKNAFKGCTSIETVTIPDFVHTIEQDAFAGCSNIKKVYVNRLDQWKDLKANTASGNDSLVNCKRVEYLDPEAPDKKPIGPSGVKMDVSEKLVDMVIGLNPFHGTAYKSGNGYKIGYGTPANKNDKISQADARNILREYLEVAAGEVNSVLGASVTKAEREALAAFSYKNGVDWLYGSGALANAVKNGHTGTRLINAFCRQSLEWTDAALNARLCEANLYLNGEYSASAPANFGVVRLDPNGGESSSYGDVKGYDRHVTNSIEMAYAPTRLGYDFVGWYTEAGAKQGKLITALDATTNMTTLYAHWQAHDEGEKNDEIVGKKVSYQLPSYVADPSTYDSSNRIKLFANPGNTVHTSTIDANVIVDVVREYRHPITGDLWVRLRNSGWMNLGQKVKAVEAGTVKLDPMKRLSVLSTANKLTTAIGSLRNGDAVAIFERDFIGSKEWGKTVFLNADKNLYQVGWIDLSFVEMLGASSGNDSSDEEPQQEDHSESPNGKAPISSGVVTGTDNVNVRANPNVYGQFYCKLPRGTEVKIYDKTTTNGVEWALINEGWACMQYIQEKSNVPQEEEEEEKVPANPGDVGTEENTQPLAKGQAMSNITLNVRKGPGAQYAKVDTLFNGARFNIYQTKMSNGVQWGRMEKGWVCMTYVRLDGDVTISGGNGSGNDSSSTEKEEPKTLGQARVVNCSTHVNVRANATPQSALQGTYALGSVIELLEETSNNGFDWYRTAKGWVCGTYVQKINAPSINKPVTPVIPDGNTNVPGTTTATTGTITGSNSVNVRKGPGVYNAKVTTLRSGSRVNIKGSQVVDGATWYEIDQGWVAGQYVLVGGSASSGAGNDAFIGGTTETTNGKYATGTIAQAGTKVRAGAGYGYKEVKTLNLGDTVTIYEQQLLDGVAWGRINNTDWVNLAFVTLDSTGVTGTGTMGVIYRCGHAVNVRRTASVDSARMATLLLNSPVEILETKDLGNGEVWGRTPQGWVNMYYVNLTGALPTPPLEIPQENTPAPTVPSTPVNPEKPKPSNQGIPFNMSGMMIADAPLRMVPGVMGDFDASIANGQTVQIMKLEKVDGELWGLLEAGWVNLRKVQISTFVVSEKAQLVYKDASTQTAIRAINKGEMVTIQELSMDANKKVWGRIGTDEWIELTAITKPETYEKTFMAKGTANVELAVRATASAEAAKAAEPLAAGQLVTITALDRDVDGNLWGYMGQGWVRMDLVTINYNARVITKTLVGWNDYDRNVAQDILNQGDTITISGIKLNNVGVPMGFEGALGIWVELSALTII